MSVERVADRFEIIDVAGRGGMGTVHRALDSESGRMVALKISSAPEHGARFIEEATALSRIRHPAVVEYVSHGTLSDGLAFVAMQWIDGTSLHQHLRGNQALDPVASVSLVGRIARGLGAAHRAGIIHRDIKPGNVMLRDGSIDDPVIVDFGLARREHHAGVTHTGLLLGTPSYIAPEQARGQRDIDARVDVFSLGCLLFRTLTGRTPFQGKDAIEVLTKVLLEAPPNLRDLLNTCPSSLERLMSMMLAKEPSERPRDGDALASMLESFDWNEEEPSHTTVLTNTEQRVVSIIMAHHVALSSIAEVMSAHGARVESLVNGGFVGVVAGAGSEQAVRSARCALAVRAAAPSVKIAVATGRADVSGVAPVGEVIETAAALLRADTASGIRIDDVTRGLLDARFQIDDQVLVSEQVREIESRVVMGKVTPFVGREHELAALLAFADRVSDGGAGAMLVTASAGYGKTRLRVELTRRIARDHDQGQMWRARGDVMGASSPFGFTSQLVLSAVGATGNDSAIARRRKVHARAMQTLGDDRGERVAVFLCEMLGCGDETTTRSDLDLARRDAQVMRDQIRNAWAELVKAEAENKPLLFVLDDLQWGDVPSMTLFDLALDACIDLPFGIIAFARPEIHTTFPELWRDRTTSELKLGPLPKRASMEVIRAITGETLSPETVARLIDMAGGNTFYLEELLRSLADGRERLPETVLATSQTRLEKLAPSLRRALRAASIFGQRFWRSGVALLTGASEVEVAAWLTALESDEFITTSRTSRFVDQSEHAFRHALLREVGYATLTDGDRAVGHGLVATWLVERGERDARTLAEHHLKSADPSLAIPYVVRLAEQAAEAGDWEEATRRAEQANVLGASGDPLVRAMLVRAEIALWQGRDGSIAANVAVANASEGSSLWCRAVACAAVLATRSAQHATLDSLGQAMRAVVLRGNPSPDIVAALAQLAFATLSASRDSRELFELLEASHASTLDASAYVRVRVEHALFIHRSIVVGNREEHFVVLRNVIDDVARLGDPRSAAYFRSNLAYGEILAGRLDQAADDLRDVANASKQLGLPHTVTNALHTMGLVAFRRGRADEAKSLQLEALASLGHDRRLLGAIRAAIARAELACGNLDAADAQADKLDPDTPSLFRGHALSTRAAVALRRGDPARAMMLSDEAMKLVEGSPETDEQHMHVNLVRAAALRAVGRLDESRTLVHALKAWLVDRRDASALDSDLDYMELVALERSFDH